MVNKRIYLRSREIIVKRLTHKNSLLIDPHNLFWCVVDKYLKKENLNKIYTYQLRTHLDQIMHNTLFGECLTSFEVHLTEQCNFRCAYCYNDLNRISKARITTPQLELIIEKIISFCQKDNNIPQVTFHGGEPFLEKRTLKDAVKKYHKSVQFHVQTNGSLISEEDASYLRNFNVDIGISLDGIGPINNLTRKIINSEDSFSIIEKPLEYLPKYVKTGVIITITNRNVNHIIELLKYLYHKGYRSVLLVPVSPENHSILPYVPSIKSLTDCIFKAIEYLISINRDRPYDKFVIENIGAYVLNIISDRRSSICRMSPCGAGRYILVIDSSGDIYPCSGFIGKNDWKMGNIFFDEISKILESKVRQVLLNRTTDIIPGCSICEYQQICGANCPLEPLSIFGNLLERSYYCEYHKKLIDHLFRLILKNPDNIFYLLSNQECDTLLKKKPDYVL